MRTDDAYAVEGSRWYIGAVLTCGVDARAELERRRRRAEDVIARHGPLYFGISIADATLLGPAYATRTNVDFLGRTIDSFEEELVGQYAAWLSSESNDVDHAARRYVVACRELPRVA